MTVYVSKTHKTVAQETGSKQPYLNYLQLASDLAVIWFVGMVKTVTPHLHDKPHLTVAIVVLGQVPPCGVNQQINNNIRRFETRSG